MQIGCPEEVQLEISPNAKQSVHISTHVPHDIHFILDSNYKQVQLNAIQCHLASSLRDSLRPVSVLNESSLFYSVDLSFIKFSIEVSSSSYSDIFFRYDINKMK